MEKIGLIAGSSGDTLYRELKKRNLKIYMICGSENEIEGNEASDILIMDLRNKEKILKYLKNRHVHLVLIGTGHYLALELADYLNQNGICTNLDYHKSMFVKDKVKFKNFLYNNNIKTPEYIIIKKSDNSDINLSNLQLPVVVKSSTDAVQPCKISSIDDLKEKIEMIKKTNTDILIEEYIDGGDCTEIITNDGKKIKSIYLSDYSKAKEYNLEGFDKAESAVITDEIKQKIKKISSFIVKTLNIQGLIRVDFMIKEFDIYVLELNSVIIVGSNGSLTKYLKRKKINLDLANIMVNTAFNIFENNMNMMV